MAKHKALKDAIREKAIRQQLEQSLKEQYQRGLLIGSKSMLKVIAETIAAEDKTTEEKLASVMKFCNTLLDITKSTEVGSTDAKERLEEVVGKEEEQDSGTMEIPQPAEASDEV